MKISTIFAFILILGLIGIGHMHEQAHVEIFRHHGISSHVKYLSHFPHFVTISESQCPTEECLLANNINDIIGYPLLIIYSVMGLVCFIIIYLLEDIWYIKLVESRKC